MSAAFAQIEQKVLRANPIRWFRLVPSWKSRPSWTSKGGTWAISKLILSNFCNRLVSRTFSIITSYPMWTLLARSRWLIHVDRRRCATRECTGYIRNHESSLLNLHTYLPTYIHINLHICISLYGKWAREEPDRWERKKHYGVTANAWVLLD